MPAVSIRITARLDADTNALFAPLERRAQQASSRIEKLLSDAVKAGTSGGGFGRVGAGGGGGAASPEVQAAKAKVKAERDAAKERAKIDADAQRASNQLMANLIAQRKAQEKKDNAEKVRAARQTARELAKIDADAQRASNELLANLASQRKAREKKDAADALAASRKADRDKLRGEREAARESARIARDAARERENIEKAWMNGSRLALRRGLQEEKRERAKAVSEEHSAVTEARAAARQRDSRLRGAVEYGTRAVINRGSHMVQRALGSGANMVREVAEGAGVNMNLGSYVSQHVQADAAARLLSNAAYQPQQGGVAAARVSADYIASHAEKISNETGYSKLDVIQGLAGVVELTGDLATAMDTIRETAILARGTGTDLPVAMKALGENLNALRQEGTSQTKQQLVESALLMGRTQAGMGQLGAFEQKDIARYGARLAAPASAYAGDRAKNLGELTAMAEMARLRGGASTAAMAATSVQSFHASLGKGARVEGFKHAGVTLRDKGINEYHSPKQIILDALRATKGDAGAMAKLFPDVMAHRAVRGFEAIYHEAGGGQKGLDAVALKFDEFSKSVQSSYQVFQAFQVSMGGADMQAAKFNNQMQAAVGRLTQAIIPMLVKAEPQITKALTGIVDGFIKLAPALEKILKATAGWVQSAAENPRTAALKVAATVVTAAAVQGAAVKGASALASSIFGGAATSAAATAAASGASGAAPGVIAGVGGAVPGVVGGGMGLGLMGGIGIAGLGLLGAYGAYASADNVLDFTGVGSGAREAASQAAFAGSAAAAAATNQHSKYTESLTVPEAQDRAARLDAQAEALRIEREANDAAARVIHEKERRNLEVPFGAMDAPTPLMLTDQEREVLGKEESRSAGIGSEARMRASSAALRFATGDMSQTSFLQEKAKMEDLLKEQLALHTPKADAAAMEIRTGLSVMQSALDRTFKVHVVGSSEVSTYAAKRDAPKLLGGGGSFITPPRGTAGGLGPCRQRLHPFSAPRLGASSFR